MPYFWFIHGCTMGVFGARKNKDVTAQNAKYAGVVVCSLTENFHPRPYDTHRQAVSDRFAKTAHKGAQPPKWGAFSTFLARGRHQDCW